MKTDVITVDAVRSDGQLTGDFSYDTSLDVVVIGIAKDVSVIAINVGFQVNDDTPAGACEDCEVALGKQSFKVLDKATHNLLAVVESPTVIDFPLGSFTCGFSSRLGLHLCFISSSLFGAAGFCALNSRMSGCNVGKDSGMAGFGGRHCKGLKVGELVGLVTLH